MLNVSRVFSQAGQAIKNALIPAGPSKAEILQKALFAQGPAVSKGEPLISGHSMGSVFMVGDYTSLYRSAEDTAMGLLSQYPGTSFDWMKGVFTSKDMIVDYHTFGTVSGINILIGLAKASHASSQIDYANAIGDSRGALIGRVGLLEGASVGGAGATYGAFRVLSIMDTVRDIKPESLLGRISSGLATSGIVLYGLFFVFLAGIFGVQGYEQVQLKNKLKKAKDLSKQVEILQRKLQVKPDKVFEKLVKKHGSETLARKALIDEAYAIGKKQLRALLKELNMEKVSDEKLKEVIDQALEAGVSGWTAASIQKQVEEKLVMIGLQMKVQKLELKKHSKIGRILNCSGIKAMEELRADATLAKRVKLEDIDAIKKANRLVEAVKVSNQKKITESAVVIGILVLGIVTMVAAIVLTGGTGLIAASALMLIFSVFMILVDGYYLLESYRGELPARHDKKMLILSSVMGISSLLTMGILMATGAVSFGVVPLVVAGILAALWLGQNGVTWAVMNRIEKRHFEQYPTLEALYKALDKEEKEHADVMMKNLSEVHRQMLAFEMKIHDGDMKQAVKALIQRVESAKKAHLESLREAVTPYLVRLSVTR